MYNLIKYSDNYAKASGSLCQYFIDGPNDSITDSDSLKLKARITGRNPAAGNTKDVEINMALKYLSNIWRTLEFPLINCEINIILVVIASVNGIKTAFQAKLSSFLICRRNTTASTETFIEK